MAFRKIMSPTGKTFHWKCETLNCPYESEKIPIGKLRIDKNAINTKPPIRCPNCGCK
jgi:DNA-directed RNA polymerase subunit RPC12/RpoP